MAVPAVENTIHPQLLPLPQLCRNITAPGDVAQTAGNAATTLVWPGVFDVRVEQRVDELLGDAACGNLQINIASSAAQYPALDDDESYSLQIESQGISLNAQTAWGALHGVTTLWQLHASGQLHSGSWYVEDSPRFPWRGLLIDVARHFMPMDLLRRVVEGMARLKMNVLHLHLTDDQGFRFESEAFPRLASDMSYSQAELRSLVDYAGERGVRVVPELDVPGHVTSWLVGYPDWGVQTVSPTSKFGVHKACLNPADEAVYTALGTLFTEVGDVFVDKHVHIGGDEVHPAWWREDASIQAFIAAHQLRDVSGMQTYFNQRLHAELTRQGKCVVGWDEVLHPDMPEFVVQNWRGATTRDNVLARPLDCIVSSGYYLDLFYPADIYYRFDPEADQALLVALEEDMKSDARLAHVAAGLQWTAQWRDTAIDIDKDAEGGRVLGGEACLWSELVDADTLEVRLWSRLPAVAERLWSSADTRDVQGFYRRMRALHGWPGFALATLQRSRLQALGLTAAQIDVAALLEPVKWYARLLGEVVLQARLAGQEMPQARPYDVHSRLSRIVDFIAPESLSALDLADASPEELRGLCASWVAQDPQLWPHDAQQAIQGLVEVGRIMLDYLDAQPATQAQQAACTAQLRARYTPHGEYMLAAIPSLLRSMERWAASER